MVKLDVELASSWISAFGEAVSQGNIEALLDCLDPSCWLRDLLIFTPSLETRHGHVAIRVYLQNALCEIQISNFVLDTDPHGKPHASDFGPGTPVIASAFDFETPKALGRGFVRLYYPNDGDTPKAITVMMMLSDWKGHEETANESGVYDGHNLTWGEVYRRRREEIEKKPQVVIVGGAQTGLQVAARFRQMGIRTLVIEQTARVGDVWRNRYPTLALHTPRSHHGLLYQPFPSNWPTFTPRDKLANWLEQYVDNQDLVVWTSTTPIQTPKYDSTTKCWDLTLYRRSHTPSLPGSSSFSGTILHASAFPGGEPFKGQRVVVVGAGNTSADVCQDLVFRGAQSVTMVQRSSSLVVSDKYFGAMLAPVFPEDRPVYYSDLVYASLSNGAFFELGKRSQSLADEFDKEMHEGLIKAGFKLDSGPDNAGILAKAFDRLGGYFIDVGCAALIINGQVKVKQGVEIDHLTEKRVVFSDGFGLDADAIILATGWHRLRDKLIRIFGREAIDNTSQLLGTDEYGETRAGYKPSGQPGLWFAAGDFSNSRFSSKLLTLNDLGNVLCVRFEQYGKIGDLEEAIKFCRTALEFCPDGHPDRCSSLDSLAGSLQTRFHQFGQLADLDDAVWHFRAALQLRPDGHSDRSASLNNLASSLSTRFEQHGQAADLDEAIGLHRAALELLPSGHPDRFKSLSNLATSLTTRYIQDGRTADLDDAIEHLRASLKLCCNSRHPNYSASLNNLANCLRIRFQQHGQTTDLDEAIEYVRTALELQPNGHSNRSSSLNNLAASLQIRFNQHGKAADLDEAIGHHRAALQLSPKGHPERYVSLTSLSVSLEMRFDQHGQAADLDEAIEHYRAALELLSSTHPNRLITLNNLAGSLRTRFEQRGRAADLDEAIVHHRAALAVCPIGYPKRSACLNNLGVSLIIRFNQHGRTADLDDAIKLFCTGLALYPDSNPNRTESLNNLASSLRIRFEQYGRIADIDKSIEYGRAALQLRPDGHPNRYIPLNNLATSFGTRFRHYGRSADLDEAIKHHRATLLFHPDGHPSRPITLNNLAASLQDLDEVIEHHRAALDLLAEGHPNLSMSLANLAFSLYSRFKKFGTIDDFEECMRLRERATGYEFSSLVTRLEVAGHWASHARSHAHHSTSRAYKMVVSLLQRAIIINPTLHAQHDFLREKLDYGMLTLDAAAFAVQQNRLEEAIEILEQGRCLLWSQMRGFRTPLDHLADINRELADKFRNVSHQLENLATLHTGLQSDSDRSRRTSVLDLHRERTLFEEKLRLKKQLSNEQEGIINEIRQIPGFEDFLTATPFKILQQAALEGPLIVLNHCTYRSDALIALAPEDLPVVCVPLDGEFYKDSMKLCGELLGKRARSRASSLEYDEILCRVMKTLWDRVVSKVVNKLKELGIAEGSRIWWYPTSVLSALPFHAAGPFEGTNGTMKYLLDDYVSSYTPTLGALINARSESRENIDKPRMLIVGDTITLQMTEAEGDSLKRLQKVTWVHFACHGHLGSGPFDSSFKLSDAGLTLLDIIRANLPNAEFAFLSACHTAEQDPSGSYDEVLHLAAAVQFCGFRSVIGTMWGKYGEVIHKRSAAAIRKAVLELRNQDGVQTEQWVNLVHIGA
ncbi:uncharacterized protein FOMMEDRAFT_161183 [Fomitiporia mediterranea MF3/22]|uniref:uncharacterized protein n=1 Tax=Fomitiporia mediterranea (strain MF3/22) TaxID=694068 RepID=UPI0004407EE7|nr:uncharacterized protein FOMMEDRAFT_161183 [Fomitiporia mediterranea MF3/22]EJC98971.1 hypothetical protein FOMMEDRAFT_161183 [Fomitiporia mediterranea MF3/22]